MRKGIKHKLRRFLIGIALFLGGLFMVSPCQFEVGGQGRFVCALFWVWQIGSLPWQPISSSNPLLFSTTAISGALGAPAFLAMLGGVLIMISAFIPLKYEVRDCPTCGMKTRQFLSKTNLQPYVPYSKVAFWNKNPEDVVSYEYTCEICSRKNIQEIAAEIAVKKPGLGTKQGVCPICKKVTEQVVSHGSVKVIGFASRELICAVCKTTLYDDPPISKQSFVLPFCHKCGQPMHLINVKKQRWYCKKDKVELFGDGTYPQSATAEPSKPQTDSKAVQTQATVMEPIPQTLTPDISSESKHCRYCGAKIPRTSKFCEECGTNLT